MTVPDHAGLPLAEVEARLNSTKEYTEGVGELFLKDPPKALGALVDALLVAQSYRDDKLTFATLAAEQRLEKLGLLK